MKRCGALDCSNINGATYLCTLPFIELDKRAQCISYNLNKEYLDLLLHQYINGAQVEGYDPETQEMVVMATSLHHTPSRKAGEEGNQVA